MKRLAILTGAGMSADSGLKTFRDAGGLWEGHDVMEVASPEGWQANPELVLDFYNQRRKQLLDARPNAGHQALVRLEDSYQVDIITQNVDDLHERAGSSNVLHLHGELFKVRSTINPGNVMEWKTDLNLGETCDLGGQLRPHIVWFGEDVPAMLDAIELVQQSDMVIIVGTSMQVYPAAGLVHYAPKGIPVYYVDPNPNISYELAQVLDLEVVREPAASGVPLVVDRLLG